MFRRCSNDFRVCLGRCANINKSNGIIFKEGFAVRNIPGNTELSCYFFSQRQVEVRDTGTGIPPELLKRIFEPFFTTKGVGKGTGLGLAITRRIIEAHSGTIKIAAHPEGGTAVTIDLPIEGEEEA